MHIDEQREDAELFSLLGALDHPVPRVDARAVAALATRRRPAYLRWAAGIVLGLGLAGAAYALPGSPLRAWVRALVHGTAPGPTQADSGFAGIAVAPGQGLSVVFTARQAVGSADVILTDSAEVVVRALTGAATFTSAADRLVIENTGSDATFEIQIPRAAPRVEILVEGSSILLKAGDHLTATTACRRVAAQRFSCEVRPR